MITKLYQIKIITKYKTNFEMKRKKNWKKKNVLIWFCLILKSKDKKPCAKICFQCYESVDT